MGEKRSDAVSSYWLAIAVRFHQLQRLIANEIRKNANGANIRFVGV